MCLITKACLSQMTINTARKMSKYGAFSGLYFTVFSPKSETQGPEKAPYLDTFHTVKVVIKHYRMEKKYFSMTLLIGFHNKEWTRIEIDKLW